MPNKTRLKLNDGSRVAVIGGGPAGSFFSYFLMDMAERVGLRVHVDIFEPRDFNASGPRGCNMCAGVLHESLVQSLATEGINLPTNVVQRGLDSNILHMDVGVIRIETPRQEKRIATIFRGIGPRALCDGEGKGLDGYLMGLALQRGAQLVCDRIDQVTRIMDAKNLHSDVGRLRVQSRTGVSQVYDLVAIAAGVNSALLKQFKEVGLNYEPPRTTKTYVREYYLGEEMVSQYLGSSMHAFLLNIPGLDFGALVPKGAYVTLTLLGEDINQDVVRAFMNEPSVRQCLPPGSGTEPFACSCGPRINIQGSDHPFGHRLVFIGDCAVTRLYKDGIGSAYRAAKVAARTAVFEGVSEEDFRRHYLPFMQMVTRDNAIGKLIFKIVRQVQRIRPARQAVLRMAATEQRGRARALSGMSMVLWDMFTGSSSYTDIFLRTLRPVFWTRLLWNLAISSFATGSQSKSGSESKQLSGDAIANKVQSEKEGTMKLGALGKLYVDGEVIVRQGDLGNNMFVIQEGQVEVVEEQDGKTVRLAIREKGDSFGEMSLLERQGRSATVRALGKARVLSVDKRTLLQRLHQDPSAAYHMMTTMAHRIRELSGELARLKNSEPDAHTEPDSGSHA